jgi:hypothetical protein
MSRGLAALDLLDGGCLSNKFLMWNQAVIHAYFGLEINNCKSYVSWWVDLRVTFS